MKRPSSVISAGRQSESICRRSRQATRMRVSHASGLLPREPVADLSFRRRSSVLPVRTAIGNRLNSSPVALVTASAVAALLVAGDAVRCESFAYRSTAGPAYLPRVRMRLQAHSRQFRSLLTKRREGAWRSAGNGRCCDDVRHVALCRVHFGKSTKCPTGWEPFDVARTWCVWCGIGKERLGEAAGCLWAISGGSELRRQRPRTAAKISGSIYYRERTF